MTTITTRRAVLAGIASAPALAPAALGANIASPDPMFAVIEAHRRAMAAYHAAVDVSSRLRDDTPEHEAAAAITDRADNDLEEAGVNLTDLESASPAGVRAVLAHVLGCILEVSGDGREVCETFDGGNWRLPHTIVLDDGSEEHFIVHLLSSIEGTLRNLTAEGAA